MTDHKKFNYVLKKLGITRREFAEKIGIEYTSLTNQLAPSKPLPKWAKALVIMFDESFFVDQWCDCGKKGEYSPCF